MSNAEPAVKRSFLRARLRALKRSLILSQLRSGVWTKKYVPALRQTPSRGLAEIVSAWNPNEMILADLIQRFGLKRERALEFGVEHGFSTVALSSYFDTVTGVDTFMGDRHTGLEKDIYGETSARLAPFENIQLVRSDYRDFIREDHGYFDLIHVDIIHTFEDTYACGLWSAQHSTCTIFHDTESFLDVKRAVIRIAAATGKRFYNFDENNGLGIVV